MLQGLELTTLSSTPRVVEHRKLKQSVKVYHLGSSVSRAIFASRNRVLGFLNPKSTQELASRYSSLEKFLENYAVLGVSSKYIDDSDWTLASEQFDGGYIFQIKYKKQVYSIDDIALILHPEGKVTYFEFPARPQVRGRNTDLEIVHWAGTRCYGCYRLYHEIEKFCILDFQLLLQPDLHPTAPLTSSACLFESDGEPWEDLNVEISFHPCTLSFVGLLKSGNLLLAILRTDPITREFKWEPPVSLRKNKGSPTSVPNPPLDSTWPILQRDYSDCLRVELNSDLTKVVLIDCYTACMASKLIIYLGYMKVNFQNTTSEFLSWFKHTFDLQKKDSEFDTFYSRVQFLPRYTLILGEITHNKRVNFRDVPILCSIAVYILQSGKFSFLEVKHLDNSKPPICGGVQLRFADNFQLATYWLHEVPNTYWPDKLFFIRRLAYLIN